MVTVFGLGFVGLTTALSFAHLGYKTYGIDIDQERLKLIQNGELPFHEPYMSDELKKHIGNNLIVTDDIKEAIQNSDYIFYCVGTPYGINGAADLKYLFSAIDMTIDAISDKRFRVLITKSTIPPTTTAEKIIPYIKEKGDIANQIGIANNPEFLREGHCWEDVINADRIVVGCGDVKVAKKLEELYKPMRIPFFAVSYSTGEFIKYLSNTLLATMISYSNEMAQVADTFGGIDIAKAFRILHMDSRWNHSEMSSYVYPGCGYGGYCLPKDTNALYAQSKEKGFTPPILKSVIDTNNQRAKVIATKIVNQLAGVKKVGILGLSFKPESDDVRDTPAAQIVRELQKLSSNCKVYAYDPIAGTEFKKRYVDLNIILCTSAEEVLNNTDIIAITTAWKEFRNLDFKMKKVIDCRYML